MIAAPVRLDHNSHVPLHAQAEDLLRHLIRRASYRNGALLPDEVTLARQLGVSRNTLRAGIARLVNEGLLERRQGVGTRVTSQRLESGIGQWHSFTQEMQRKGISVQAFRVDARLVNAPGAVARALAIAPRRRVLRLDRLRGWEGEPAVHFRSYLHPRLQLPLDCDYSRPLYEIIESRSGVLADRSHEEMRAVAADAALGKLLRVRPATPLLRRDRVVFDASGRSIEYAVVHYLSCRFALTLDLRRGEA